MATYTYTKDINFDKFQGDVFCTATFSAKLDRVEYDGDGLSNNLKVITTEALTGGEETELGTVVSAHDNSSVAISSDVSQKDVEASAIGLGMAFLNNDSLVAYLFDDLTEINTTDSVNLAMLFDGDVLCMNDPTTDATIYTIGETCDFEPTEAGIEYSWNGQGSVTIYASREAGAVGSITWTQLTRSEVTDITAQASGSLLRLKVVLTGNASLNWIALITDATLS